MIEALRVRKRQFVKSFLSLIQRTSVGSANNLSSFESTKRARRWEINSTKLQEPAIAVKFLGTGVCWGTPHKRGQAATNGTLYR